MKGYFHTIKNISSLLLIAIVMNVNAQHLKSVEFGSNSLTVKTFNKNLEAAKPLPLVSFLLDGDLVQPNNVKLQGGKLDVDQKIQISWFPADGYKKGIKGEVTFTNISNDTLSISNVVPFGENPSNVYITGKGNHSLSRTHLFRPDYEPVNVIVPDNAWELGYSGISLVDDVSVAALTRRTDVEDALKRRFETVVAPGGSVIYELYADLYTGDWQEGLRRIFQERYLYDVEQFDNTLYERQDLDWMRHSYVIHLMMAWDDQFYDPETNEYTLGEFLERGNEWYGGDDGYGIWPTWPVLGLDQRNQWDYFRDLPGGLDGLRSMVDLTHENDTRFFICYNPWDESTRLEDHIAGMADMIEKLNANGVVLDTKGSSSDELQKGADSVREGVMMYSEGMAVPKDMQGIVSGRVHNALYYPPLLNLNKFIKPDFAIFRVAELAFDRIRREYATSFFNGYGTELNIFRPGSPEWIEDDYRFFGRTVRILRENTSNFVHKDYTPLIPTTRDNLYVNAWPKGNKIVYTIFSLIPEGHFDPLFEIEQEEGYHYVDLWNHEEVEIDTIDSKHFAKAKISGFDKQWLGTNNEGAVGAIAKLPELLEVSLNSDELSFSAEEGDKILIWAGHPDYEKNAKEYSINQQSIRLLDTFGDFEGKFVIQVFRGEELLDQRQIFIEYGSARLVSKVEKTKTTRRAPKGMVEIPAGEFVMEVSHGDAFIPYPPSPAPEKVQVDKFFMDKHPVTNAEFKKFLDEARYKPEDPVNFLKEWESGSYPEIKKNHPVVHISFEDAKAYAEWAGKRLPTELEWQYAAQTSAGYEWPWGNDDSKISKEDHFVTNTLTVSEYDGIDSTLTNPGNNQLDPVGNYPKGANLFGLEDLVGSVWQMTNDVYDNTTNRYVILKGGSYFKPASSWWYVQGGPQKLHYRQMLLRVSQSFERNATIGFRCVKDRK